MKFRSRGNENLRRSCLSLSLNKERGMLHVMLVRLYSETQLKLLRNIVFLCFCEPSSNFRFFGGIQPFTRVFGGGSSNPNPAQLSLCSKAGRHGPLGRYCTSLAVSSSLVNNLYVYQDFMPRAPGNAKPVVLSGCVPLTRFVICMCHHVIIDPQRYR